MKTSDFNYYLPEELIAQHPVEPRDHSRMLVFHKDTLEMEHKHFYDVIDYLKPGDLLVINNTKVIPARLFGKREGHDGAVEVLLLKRKELDTWECITKPARKLKIGTRLEFGEELKAEVTGYADEGIRFVKFEYEGVFEDILDRIGNMPLPPYIHERLEDKNRYQTVYSKFQGSAAAPTAGLHFTNELLEKIKAKGVEVATVVLHVGLGTFRPVKVDDINDHKMHTEYYRIDEENADKINKAVAEGRRVIAVGTTSVRTLESIADEDGYVRACSGNTNIFIYPGYKFKIVKALITNFHLPESTLIMLVSAFIGRENTLKMYETAVNEKYRFFSFGDATLLI